MGHASDAYSTHSRDCWISITAAPHQVEFDIDVTTKHIVLVVHQAGFIAAFPQGAGPSMPAVEQSDIVAAKA
jgi:hypothetical protein